MFKNSFIYIAGELIAKIFPVLLMPYLARRLGVSGYGDLAYYLAIIQLMSVFIGFSSHAAINRYFFRYGSKSIGLPVTVAIIFSCTISLVSGVVAYCFGVPIAWLLALAALGNCLLACSLSVLQCQKRAVLYVTFQLLNILFSTILTVLFLELNSVQPEYRVFALAIASLISAITLQFTLKQVVYSWSKRQLYLGAVYILSFGAPLFIHGICNFFRFEFDKIALKSVFSAEQLGVYALSAKLGALVQLILFAINKALQPVIYESLKKGTANTLLLRMQTPSFALVIIIPLIALMVPEGLFLWVFGDEYKGIKFYIVLFSLGYASLAPYFLFVNVAFYNGWTKLISFSALASVLAYVLFFYLCVKMSWNNYIPLALVFSSFVLSVCIVVPVKRRIF